MNWTGGRLSRHSRNARGSATQRQKRYFAKARNSLLKDHQKESPITWSVFDEIDGQGGREDLKLYEATQKAQPRLVRDRGRPQNRQPSVIGLKLTLPEANNQADKRCGLGREQNKQPLVYGEVDQGEYHEPVSQLDAEIGKLQDQAFVTADDMVIDPNEDSLEKRRRSILRKIDWVGANIQHPIKLRFAATASDERVAKRRRITPGHQSLFGSTAQPIITFPVAKQKPKQTPPGPPNTQSSDSKITVPLPKAHVRIFIGGRQVKAGATSSISHKENIGGRLASSQGDLSEEMLLDGDDVNRQQRQLPYERRDCPSFPASSPLAHPALGGIDTSFSASPRDQHSVTPHRKRILSSYSRLSDATNRLAASNATDVKQRVPTSWVGQENSLHEVAHDVDQHIDNIQYDQRGQNIRFVPDFHSNLVTLRSHQVRALPTNQILKANVSPTPDRVIYPDSISPSASYITGSFGEISESSKKLCSVARENPSKSFPINSPPELFHPIPLTWRTSRVLCGTSPGVPGGNAEEIDSQAIATRSQMLDEGIRKTWVPSSQDDSSSDSNDAAYDNVSISSSIGNLGQDYVESDLNNTIESSNKSNIPQEVTVHQYGPQQEREVSAAESENCQRKFSTNFEEHVYHEQVYPKKSLVDYKDHFLSCSNKPPSPSKPKPARPKKPDEAWMEFIQSDDGNDQEDGDLESLVPQLRLLPAPMQRFPASSLIVHHSTKTTSSSQPGLIISSVRETNESTGDLSSNTTGLSIEGPQASIGATRGSYSSQSDELSQPPSSIDQIRTYPASAFSTPSKTIPKLTFTKPPRYRGSYRNNSPESAAATAGSPAHIGRAFSYSQLKGKGTGKKRDIDNVMARRGMRPWRDLYSLESDEEVESIEDD